VLEGARYDINTAAEGVALCHQERFPLGVEVIPWQSNRDWHNCFSRPVRVATSGRRQPTRYQPMGKEYTT
jgi:hypothetical protein